MQGIPVKINNANNQNIIPLLYKLKGKFMSSVQGYIKDDLDRMIEDINNGKIILTEDDEKEIKKTLEYMDTNDGSFDEQLAFDAVRAILRPKIRRISGR